MVDKMTFKKQLEWIKSKTNTSQSIREIGKTRTGKGEKVKIMLKPADLRAIKEAANREFLTKSCPNELDGSEFLVYCYTKAVELVLCGKGASLDVEVQFKQPYEPVD